MNPLISVVIPVYNSEKYFENTIKSVVNQTFTDIEIILVNDGSTDCTPQIIDRYAASDPRIRVLNKKNAGVQYARRDGVEMAQGDYIQTMDCDDYMYPNALEVLYKKAIETDADMVVGRFIFDEIDRSIQRESVAYEKEQTTGLELFRLICEQKAYFATWTRLHKRSIYKDRPIRVYPDISSTEDTVLTAQLCYYAQKVVYINDFLIKFTVRGDSQSNSRIISNAQYAELSLFPRYISDFFVSVGVAQQTKLDIIMMEMRNVEMAFNKYRFDQAYTKCRQVRKYMKQYPSLSIALSRRMCKIVSVFHYFGYLGYVNLWRYKCQNKL